MFAVVGQQHLRSPWGQHLDYLSFISIWDAGWYEQIAVQGYLSQLPVNAAAWLSRISGFYPIFRSFPVLLAMRRASVLPGGGDGCSVCRFCGGVGDLPGV